MNLTLRHLNADTSWLISFNNFNILLDPWLFGAQTDFGRYFSTQQHATKPCIQNCHRDLDLPIHAVVISHEFTDHCHEQTLRTLSPAIPIFATKNAAKLIQRWHYFQNIFEIYNLLGELENFTFQKLSRNKPDIQLSDFISVGYLPEKGLMALPTLHGATCLSFLANDNRWHCLFYIPHGCKLYSITDWLNQQTNIGTTILLQGFHRVYNPIWLGGLLNYGCEEAAKLAVSLRVRHWISTHDEEKIASGLISVFIKRQCFTLEQAQTLVKQYCSHQDKSTMVPLVHDIHNGDSLSIELLV